MIPPGTGKNALATGVAALMAPGNVGKVAREATAWVEAAIAAVKTAPGGDAYGDDEAIAGLATAYPAVGAALEGRRPPSVAPAGGRRLSRMTIAPRARLCHDAAHGARTSRRSIHWKRKNARRAGAR